MKIGEAIERRKAQNTMLYIWLTGAVVTFVLLQLAIHQYSMHPAEFGLDSTMLPNQLEQIRKKFQEPLIAIYSPWLSIMIAAFFFGEPATRRQAIRTDKVLLAVVLSVVFQCLIVYSAYVFLFETQPAVSELSVFSPLPAMFISLIGTIVTFAFPEHKKTQRRKAAQSSNARG